jgi:hypothetical protein
LSLVFSPWLRSSLMFECVGSRWSCPSFQINSSYRTYTDNDGKRDPQLLYFSSITLVAMILLAGFFVYLRLQS